MLLMLPSKGAAVNRDSEFDSYLLLLTAIVEHAQRDAVGNTYPAKAQSPTGLTMQHEAAQFLETAAPSIFDLALPDIPLGKQRCGL